MAPQPTKLERLRTSVPGLDEIVGGGLVAGRLYLIEGRPGSGKTVLAAQLCFERARRGDRCVFLTTLSESHSTLLSNLASFEFFERGIVDERVCFISGYHTVEQGGLDALLEMVTTSVRKTKARLLVIDTLACHDEAGAARAKRFIRDIAALCSLLGCTAVCVAPPAARSGERRIEQASDGILELSRSTIGLRSARMIEVLKLRGSPSLDGKHVFTISSRGLTIYPRIEARMTAAPPMAQESRGRLSTGLPALDRMIGGGITNASSTAIAGAPGTGKTLLGLHFLAEGARVGEPGLYFGFYETPSRLIAKASRLGLSVAEQVERGRIQVLWHPSLEYSIDYLAHRLLAAVHEHKVARLFIDGVDGFRMSAFFASRLGRFFTALTNALRDAGTTTLLSEETELDTPRLGAATALSALYENIVLLRYIERGDELQRVLSIVKMRESDYDRSSRELRITGKGMELVEARGLERSVGGGAGGKARPAARRRRGT